MTSVQTPTHTSDRTPPTTLEVSIVIPTHNRAESLANVLDALALQTFDMARVEVVVVIDGSTDGTAEMLANRSWPLRLEVIEQTQSGVAAARNHGAAAAR